MNTKELTKKIMEGQSIEGFANKMLLVEKAIQEAKKEFKDAVENLENPYPFNIFLPVSKEEYTAIHNLLLKHFNISLDRISADLMRIARENVKQELLKALEEKGVKADNQAPKGDKHGNIWYNNKSNIKRWW